MTAPESRSVALDFESCYLAISSRDRRFDGQFYTAVATTGVYCRPSCPARTPHRQNVSFHLTAASAQQSGYRACQRCTPDATPGSPRWHVEATLAARAMRLIRDGVVDRSGVEGLASRLGYSTRQVTRVLTSELGVGPRALARAHRADTARMLIQSTDLPMSEIAFAAGFSSLRQFNSTISDVYARSPRELRSRGAANSTPGKVTLRLPHRGPYAARAMHAHLAAISVPGLEQVTGDTFTRVLALPNGMGIATVDLSESALGHLRVTLVLGQMRDVSAAVARLRHLFDLDADPQAVDAALMTDPALAPLVRRTPGLRSLGCLDAGELLLRAIIDSTPNTRGCGDLVRGLGVAVRDAAGRVSHAFPAPDVIADHAEVLAGPRPLVRTLVAAARALADGELDLHAGLTKIECRRRLRSLPGVDDAIADQVTMRLLRDPDTLLTNDRTVQRAAAQLGIGLDPDRWRPWASYASAHLRWLSCTGSSARTGSRSHR